MCYKRTELFTITWLVLLSVRIHLTKHKIERGNTKTMVSEQNRTDILKVEPNRFTKIDRWTIELKIAASG